MQSNLILTAAQAQAVYSAMCALNSTGATATELKFNGQNGATFGARVSGLSGAVRIDVLDFRGDMPSERHDSVPAFVAAYGLRDAPDAADLLAALKVAHLALVDYPPAPRNSFTDAATEMCRATIARNSA
ncbi:hypothetical protein ACOTB6_14195 [Achromobacter xylosoxidans]